MKNKYEIRGEVTAIKLFSPKYGEMETLISTSKLSKADEFPHLWGQESVIVQEHFMYKERC